jgi:hypothetical protein
MKNTQPVLALDFAPEPEQPEIILYAGTAEYEAWLVEAWASEPKATRCVSVARFAAPESRFSRIICGIMPKLRYNSLLCCLR